MTICRIDFHEMKARLKRRGRSARTPAPQIYHRENQVGPFSESEREIALQIGSVMRSEQEFVKFCRTLQEQDSSQQEPGQNAAANSNSKHCAGNNDTGSSRGFVKDNTSTIETHQTSNVTDRSQKAQRDPRDS